MEVDEYGFSKVKGKSTITSHTYIHTCIHTYIHTVYTFSLELTAFVNLTHCRKYPHRWLPQEQKKTRTIATVIFTTTVIGGLHSYLYDSMYVCMYVCIYELYFDYVLAYETAMIFFDLLDVLS